MPGTILEVEGITKSFGGNDAVRDVTFAVAEGQIVGLVGPNGAGKTTVFNIATGFLAADSGAVRFRGQDIAGLPPHRIVGLGLSRTFQELGIMATLTVLENVMLGFQGQVGESGFNLFVRWRRSDRQQRDLVEGAREHLRFVGMEDFRDVPASELSYGQQKRVTIARLLASGADLMCLDEPATGLDPEACKGMGRMITALCESGKTVVVIEHNLELVAEVCHTVLFMDQGRLKESGPPAAVLAKESVRSAFMGV